MSRAAKLDPGRHRRPHAVDARRRRSGRRSTPTLTALAERGTLGRATTTFPSLTPVCLSSIATGAHPDVHEIPHLVWWHRGERRLVEYGSSFGAARAAGLGRTLRDTLVGMNAEHLGRARGDALRGARRRRAAHRRGQLHRVPRPHAAPRDRAVPRHRARPGALLLLQPVPERAHGRAALVPQPRGRHRSTRTPRPSGAGSSPATASTSSSSTSPTTTTPRTRPGPTRRTTVLARCDEAVGGLVARGRRARRVPRAVRRRRDVRPRPDARARGRAARRPVPARRTATLVAASNRAGHVYRLAAAGSTPRELAERLDGEPAVEVALFREGDAAVARREGEELRFAPTRRRLRARGRRVDPRPARRASRAPVPRSGTRTPASVLVSAARGLGVRRPRRRPSPRRRLARLARRGRLAGAGADGRPRDGRPRSIVDVAPLVLAPLRRGGAAVRRCAGRHDRAVGRPAAALRSDGRRQLRRRGIADERVLAAMGACRARLFVPPALVTARLRRRGAPDRRRPDDLAAVHRRRDVRAPRARRRRARARRRHGLGLRGRRARRARGERRLDRAAARRSRSARARRSPTRGHGVRRGAGSATARSALPTGRRSTRSRCGRGDRAVPPALYEQLADGRPARAAARRLASASGSCCVVRTPAGPVETASLACSLRPAGRGLARRLSRRGHADRSATARRRAMDERRRRDRPPAISRARVVDAALRRRSNWEQLAKFCVVGATGYVVNLAVYTLLLQRCRPALHPGRGRLVPRRRDEQLPLEPPLDVPRPAGHVVYQGLRFLVVSTLALGANLVVLHLLVQAASARSSPRRSRSSSSRRSTSSATSSGRSARR